MGRISSPMVWSYCSFPPPFVLGMNQRIEDGCVREGRRPSSSGVRLSPEIVAGYMHLAFNGVLLSLVLTLVVKFMMVVRDDVHYRIEEEAARELRVIEACRKSYEQNGCRPDLRVPALEEHCEEWYHCMNRDQSCSGRRYQSGALWARTIAEILNSFIEPMSIRSTVLALSVVCALVLVTNSAFGSYRVYHYSGLTQR